MSEREFKPDVDDVVEMHKRGFPLRTGMTEGQAAALGIYDKKELPPAVAGFFDPTDRANAPVDGGVASFAEAARVATPLVPFGIVWRGPWERLETGLAQVARRMIVAIEAAGMPIRLPPAERLSMTDSSIDPDVLREIGALAPIPEPWPPPHLPADTKPPVRLQGAPARQLNRTLVSVHHVLPVAERLKGILYGSRLHDIDPEEYEKVHRYQVCMTVFERDRVDASTASYLAKFGRVWVPCIRNAQILRKAGVERVSVVPHPMPEDRRQALLKIRTERTWSGTFTFSSIGKWEPRKNQHMMLGAFLKEFGPGESVRLMLKTSAFSDLRRYPKGPKESLATWLDDADVRAKGWTSEKIRSRIAINTDSVSEEVILGLHALTHAYVNASHGEAWDLPAYDACVSGSRLIHTGFGGSEDYAPMNAIRVWEEKNVHPSHPDTSFERAHPDYLWGAGQWAKVDEARLRAAMRQAFNERERGGTPAPCDMATIGQQVVQEMIEMCGYKSLDEVRRAFP